MSSGRVGVAARRKIGREGGVRVRDVEGGGRYTMYRVTVSERKNFTQKQRVYIHACVRVRV